MVFKYDFAHAFLFTPYRKLKTQTLFLIVDESKELLIYFSRAWVRAALLLQRRKGLWTEAWTKRAKKNKDPNSNTVFCGKLEKRERQMREGGTEGRQANGNQPTVCLETLRK